MSERWGKPERPSFPPAEPFETRVSLALATALESGYFEIPGHKPYYIDHRHWSGVDVRARFISRRRRESTAARPSAPSPAPDDDRSER